MSAFGDVARTVQPTKLLGTQSSGVTPLPQPKLPALAVAFREDTRSLSSTVVPSAELPMRVEARPTPRYEVEEFFEAIVDEISDDRLRLRTKSSGGEEALAWLSIAKIPESERRYIALGAPVRVSVLLAKRPRRVRQTEVRFLRPAQWRQPLTVEMDPVVKYLTSEMQSVLGRRDA